MSLPGILRTAAVEGLVAPDAIGWIDSALRLFPDGEVDAAPRRIREPRHRCTVDAAAVDHIRRQPGGGVVICAECPRAIFIPPATCLERIEYDAEATIVIDHATGADRIIS